MRVDAVAEDDPFGPRRSREGRYVLARVSELGIEVIAESGDNLVSLLRSEATEALRRLNLSTDLKPLGGIARVPYGIAVSQRIPVQNLSELIAYARAHPGELTFASSGTGSS